MTSTTRNRFGNVGSASNINNSEQSRTPHTSSFGPGFGTGSNGWQGGIWGNTIGSGLKSGSIDNGRNQEDVGGPPSTAEVITGSGSLLPLSESDHWSGRHAAPWKSVDNTSPSVSSSHTNHSSTSPVRRQSGNQLISQPYVETNNGSSSYFSINAGATMSQGIPQKQPRKNFLDPKTGSFISHNGFDQGQVAHTSRHNSEEENRYSAKPLALGNGEVGFKVQPGRPPFPTNFSGYNSSAASRSGSLPPSRNGAEMTSRFSEEPVNNTYPNLGPSSSSHRQNLSAHSAHSNRTGHYAGKFADHASPSQLNNLSGDFNKMNLGKENHGPYFGQQKEPATSSQSPFMHEYSHQYGATDPNDNWGLEENSYHGSQDIFTVDGVPGAILPNSHQFRGAAFNATYPHSPNNSDTRRSQQSPFYPTGETPPSGPQHRIPKSGNGFNSTPNGQAAVLDRKLRGLQQIQQEQAYPPHPNPMNYRPSFAPPYDFHPQSTLRMNPLAQYYQMPPVPTLLAQSTVPRGPAREHDVSQNVRSPLLEEFRNNSKTNKRYEIKDIYNNIVEFSGDQHGSRFIQQKLETANSDEKDQVFREIHPNSLQLMTDVFGNYVIQKFFEHGNQAQKKVLANQMKNHILALSLQMYGCRVVQKALEHILTDQQAQLVKELEHHVLKCVKDQNGNHVVQKAIERVPAEHIQFIINAFTGQVHGLATHPYGCRVIQRMLEHCEEPTRSAVLQELHACASTLIIDQYGNYVTQHVIEHGKEDDRAKVISLITGNLVNFSKHKFASNVVEKSIQFGSADQRQKIIDTLTVLNDKGESPLQSLIRDQYGNYVIQKLLTQLKDSEFERFVELIRPQLALLKRFSYGKQIAAIEKVVYNTPTTLLQMPNNPSLPLSISSAAPTPPLLAGDAQSPQSSSLPSTHAGSINGAIESRKSSDSNTMEVMTPTSA